MKKIICSLENYEKLRECFKKGSCPVEDNTDDYCYGQCIYNKYNIEFEEVGDNDKITLVSLNDDIVCYKKGIFNYPKCGEVNIQENCESCKFYYENVKYIER